MNLCRIKARKKDCHSTVFERLDGVLPLLLLQHWTCTRQPPILTALPSFPIWSGAGKEGGVSCIMESLVHILFLPQLLHMIQMFSSCAASALPPLQGKKYAAALAPFLISQKGNTLVPSMKFLTAPAVPACLRTPLVNFTVCPPSPRQTCTDLQSEII